MHRLERLVNDATKKHPFKRYILAVSGGLDSMVMLALFEKMKFPFEVAHVNYQLRGLESDKDQSFVEDYCGRKGLIMHACKSNLSEYIKVNKGNLQQEDRRIRYDFFRNITANSKDSVVVTAHHQDDQLETFWLMLGRSAGMSGLSGMAVLSNSIYRPLLDFSKNELLEYAIENSIEWREDASNQKNDYQRNLWRNELLPYLHTQIPSLKASVLCLMDCFKKEQVLLDKKVHIVLSKLKKSNCLNFNDYDQLTTHQLIEIFKSVEIPLLKLIDLNKIRFSQKGKAITIETVGSNILQIIREEDYFYFAPKHQNEVLPQLIVLSENYIPAVLSKNIVFLDKDKLQGELTLRLWKKGDRINLIGLKGSKLVSDILSDAKIPNYMRKSQCVVVDESRIIACLGLAVGRDCIADQHSRAIISIRLG